MSRETYYCPHCKAPLVLRASDFVPMPATGLRWSGEILCTKCHRRSTFALKARAIAAVGAFLAAAASFLALAFLDRKLCIGQCHDFVATSPGNVLLAVAMVGIPCIIAAMVSALICQRFGALVRDQGGG